MIQNAMAKLDFVVSLGDGIFTKIRKLVDDNNRMVKELLHELRKIYTSSSFQAVDTLRVASTVFYLMNQSQAGIDISQSS